VGRLQNSKDPEGLLFQKVAEQGHYGGRVQPTNTRQGTYAFTPSGIFLGSINSNDPNQMRRMMEGALAKWDELSREERLMPADPSDQTPLVRRPEAKYPEGGLVFRVYSRDLPREDQVTGWRADAWNQDFLWFRKDEMKAFVPEGGEGEVPAPLVRRMARLNFVDNVRGQTPHFQDRHVEIAWMRAQVVRRDGDVLIIRYSGETRAEESGNWAVAGFDDMRSPSAQVRGVRTRIYGYGHWDSKAERFRSFDLAAIGSRWGATQYNGRRDDRGPAPIGYALTLAGDRPEDRVAPAYHWEYRW
jgi:hypothetical protein